MNKKCLFIYVGIIVLLAVVVTAGYAHANHRYKDYSLKEVSVGRNEWIPAKGYDFKIVDFYKEKTADSNWSNLVFTLKVNKKPNNKIAYLGDLFDNLFITSKHTSVGQCEGIYNQKGKRVKLKENKESIYIVKFEQFEKKATAKEQIELGYIKRTFPNYTKYRFKVKEG
ncbi:hypothetical protein [Listeria sp. PSOL-1]|uniref:hypothetical protein n=1 Tax=Listeria sp. PSOL-1 TaxID=1844999 RepID=UPI0013D30C58|nr:hypothetical protein [Listeria sp. PSOL-1]